jgi:hypothetical protein
MSEGPEKKPINYGDPVVFQEPSKPESGGGGSWAAPLLLVLGMFGVVVVLAVMPSQPAVPSVPPGSGAPIPTWAPGIPTPTSFLPSGGAQSAAIPCQPGIQAGQTVVCVANGVRIRQSPGYIVKDDATDTMGYLQRGDEALAVGGPVQMDGLCWWNVQYQNVTGWSADHSETGELLLVAGP